MTGFSYELCDRNAALVSSGAVKQPSAKKTGTTIAGVIFKVWILLFNEYERILIDPMLLGYAHIYTCIVSHFFCC